jgi:hypothetical protein
MNPKLQKSFGRLMHCLSFRYVFFFFFFKHKLLICFIQSYCGLDEVWKKRDDNVNIYIPVYALKNFIIIIIIIIIFYAKLTEERK